jgi:zinc protease
MMYLYFTRPRFDETSFQAYMTRVKGMLANKAASPEAAFQDTLTAVMANYNERAMPETVETLERADFKRIQEIGKERFRNAADFTFFFVGNIDMETLKPLVEQYIGGLPYFDNTEEWRNLNIDPPSGVVEKLVEKGQEEKSLQYIAFHGDFDYSSKNALELDAVGRILSTRLLEVIREDKSSVYSISARPSSSKYPEEEYSVGIYYGTSPDKLADLKEAVFAEIRDFIENGPSDEELAKAKEKLLREREISLRENNFWLSILSNTYYLKDGDFSSFGTFDEIVEGMTTESIQKAFKKYFDFDNYVSVALKPAG